MLTPPRVRRESRASSSDANVDDGGGSSWRLRFHSLFGFFPSKAPEPPVDPAVSALLAFPAESFARAHPAPLADSGRRSARKAGRRALVRSLFILATVVLAPSLAVIAIRRVAPSPSGPTEPQTGQLTIDTRLVMSDVRIDGARRGVTPLTVSLAPGEHTITVRSGDDERIVPLTIAAGAKVTQYFDMRPAEAGAVLGGLSVTTDPPGARVTVDGRPRGSAPITLTGLTAEEHRVSVASVTGSAERTVIVTAGGTASVLFSLSKIAGPVGGWLSISAPFEVEVAENGEVIGTSGASRIMLVAGGHLLSLASRSVGYQEDRRLEVTAGKTIEIRVDPPKASLSVNARPWAEVVLDGNSLGQTPIANLLVSVGSHEMVFKHPQLGERTQNVTVTAHGPNRVAVDLTK